MKYKLFSKCSIKQVRSLHWHWPSGLDTLGCFLARWISGCLYFTRGVCCFFPPLYAVFPSHCDAGFQHWIHRIRSLPINTCHSFFFYISWKLTNRQKKMEGNLGVVAKEQCMIIITKETLELISTPFHLEASAEDSLDKLRGLTNMNCTIYCMV